MSKFDLAAKIAAKLAETAAPIKEQKMLQGMYRGYAGDYDVAKAAEASGLIYATPQRPAAEMYAASRSKQAAKRGDDPTPHVEMLMVDPFVGRRYGHSTRGTGANPPIRTLAAEYTPDQIQSTTGLYAQGGPVSRPMEHKRSEGQDASTQPLTGSAIKALVRGWMAGTAGLPGDLEGLARAGLHMGAAPDSWFAKNVSRDPALPTSEFYKDWLPGKQQGDDVLNSIGSIFGGVGATKPVALTRGALSRVAAAAPGPMVGGRAAQRGVIKAPGGNWLSGSVEDALRGLKPRVRTEGVNGHTAQDILADQAMGNFIDKQLTRYVKNDMATERDPIRALAERGTLHMDPAQLNFQLPMHGKYLEEGQTAVAKSDAAKAWEGASDMQIAKMKAGELLKGDGWFPDTAAIRNAAERNPWLATKPEGTEVVAVHERMMPQDLGFDHLIDELRNATNPQSGLPANLLLKPESLDRVSVPQAVEHVAKINAWREAQKVEANAAKANNAATHVFKEYAENNPKGLKWVELKSPPAKGIDDLTEDQASWYSDYISEGVSPERALREASNRGDSTLKDALKYEGDTMGHCVGGYCPDVLEGRSRIFSLRSAKGEPHVTIEVQPQKRWNTDTIPNTEEDIGQRIVQIKGKANRKPNDEYLPFVQDFVKSGTWSDVGDLQNTGLKSRSAMFDRRALEKPEISALPEYFTQDELEAAQKAYAAKLRGEPGFADGGSVRGAINAAVGSSNLAKQVGSSADAVRSIAAGNGSLSDLNSLRQMASELGYIAPGLSQVMGLAATAKAGYNMATDPTGMNAAKFAAKVNPIAAQALSLYQMATDAKPMDAANFIVGFHPVLRAYNGLADAFGFANIGQLAANLTEIGDPQSPVQLQDLFSNTPMYDANARVLTAPDGILNANSPDFVGPVYTGPSLTGNGTTGEASVSSSGWSFPSYSGGDGINGHSGSSSGNPGGIGG